MADERVGLNDRLTEATEKLVAEGKLPAWMERLSYDTARVTFGGGGEFIVVASPPKSATAQLRNANAELTRIAEIAQRPDDPAKAEELGKAMQRLADLATAAEVAYFTATILEVGPGLKFRADVTLDGAVVFAAGDSIPIPRTVRDPAKRALLVSDGIPEMVLSRVRDAVGFLNAQGAAALLGNA